MTGPETDSQPQNAPPNTPERELTAEERAAFASMPGVDAAIEAAATAGDTPSTFTNQVRNTPDGNDPDAPDMAAIFATGRALLNGMQWLIRQQMGVPPHFARAHHDAGAEALKQVTDALDLIATVELSEAGMMDPPVDLEDWAMGLPRESYITLVAALHAMVGAAGVLGEQSAIASLLKAVFYVCALEKRTTGQSVISPGAMLRRLHDETAQLMATIGRDNGRDLWSAMINVMRLMSDSGRGKLLRGWFAELVALADQTSPPDQIGAA